MVKNPWNLPKIYTTIGIVRCTLGVAIDDLAVKAYIPQKILLKWICCKCLAWWHRHIHFWPQRSWRLLEAKNTPQRPKKVFELWKKWNASDATPGLLAIRIQIVKLLLKTVSISQSWKIWNMSFSPLDHRKFDFKLHSYIGTSSAVPLLHQSYKCPV